MRAFFVTCDILLLKKISSCFQCLESSINVCFESINIDVAEVLFTTNKILFIDKKIFVVQIVHELLADWTK